MPFIRKVCVLFKTRPMSSGLIFPRINGPNVAFIFLRAFRKVPIVATFITFVVSLLSRGRYCRGQKNHKQSWRSLFPEMENISGFQLLTLLSGGGS